MNQKPVPDTATDSCAEDGDTGLALLLDHWSCCIICLQIGVIFQCVFTFLREFNVTFSGWGPVFHEQGMIKDFNTTIVSLKMF